MCARTFTLPWDRDIRTSNGSSLNKKRKFLRQLNSKRKIVAFVIYSSDSSDGFPFNNRFLTSFKSNSTSLLLCMCWMANFVSSISFSKLSRFFSETFVNKMIPFYRVVLKNGHVLKMVSVTVNPKCTQNFN